MHDIKVIVEKHPDGYVAYPLGLNGVVVGQGDSYGKALTDVKSAIRFHVETFGISACPSDRRVCGATSAVDRDQRADAANGGTR